MFKVLDRRAYRVGLASNFDGRLHSVLSGYPSLARLAPIVISSEVGWRKPSSEFFAAMCQAVELAPPEVLYVGDDIVNDYQGALAAGCRALLLDPSGCAGLESGMIQKPNDVLYFLDANQGDVLD
jgi:putative hydrolase of the HAD superfamily